MFDYNVNDLGQRTSLSKSGTAFGAAQTLAWGYNARGEVTQEDHNDQTQSSAYQYDGIGNRIESVTGSTTLTWDAENRLTQITKADGTVINYAYDYLSRRISKTAGGTTTHYLYNGWNCIAEYQGNTLSKTLTWGSDLSGSMQGAGGVGGLLATTDHSAAGIPSYYPTYDGNGNVSEYLDSSGTNVAHFEYDAFGNVNASTGAIADFDIRFSTKKRDEESGLYYYGYRYYDPQTGRWPSRDPLEEYGGYNLYGMVDNDPVNYIDILGLIIEIPGDDCYKKKVKENLDKLKSEPKGKELVEKLENRKNKHIIKKGDKGNSIKPEKGYKEGGEGTGSTTTYNPDRKTGGTDSTGSKKRPPFVGLGHELGHAEAIDNGTQSYDKGSEEKGTTPPSEKNSMKRENQIRKEHGLKDRPYYYSK